MKILLVSSHRYPAGGRTGAGLGANPRTTGGAAFVHDNLAKGLAELGHEVHCLLPEGFDPSLPPGVRHAVRVPPGAEILHQVNAQFLLDYWPRRALARLGLPWLATCHIRATPPAPPGHRRGAMPPNWVTVSRWLARAYDHPRFVPNGVDPAELIYSAAKGDYFLFASRADAADEKGLPTALGVAREVGVPLTVMASSTSDEIMGRLAARCREAGARFAGDARGRRKSELFAGARALLLPTEMDEGGPLVIAEALMSGTPVIASDRGACPEMIAPGVGFIGRTRDDYLRAAERVGALRREDCRRHAIESFHHRVMARRYVEEYREEVAAYAADPGGYLERSLARLPGGPNADRTRARA